MRVLHVSNHSVDRCGIANFGRQLSTALRLAGCMVTDWDGQYSVIYEKVQKGEPAYLPPDAADYDVVHFNWHPVTINHYGPAHFEGVKLLSVYLNDLPPWSGCPVADYADVLFAPEPSDRCRILPYPIGDWMALPAPDPVFTVGYSGIRGDGIAETRAICKHRGYAINEPSPTWLTYEEEVQRLARSTVNVCWYREGRGISGGASQVTSARRPVILSSSPMFAHLRPYLDEYYHPGGDLDLTLDTLLGRVYADWQQGTLRTPRRVLDSLSWGVAALRMISIWEQGRVRG